MQTNKKRKQNILEAMQSRRLYFDGGTGSQLIARGLRGGVASEEANFLYPQWVLDIHRSYLDAGANIIKTNTFGVSSLKYENYEEYISRALDIAEKATEGREDSYIAFDIGPLGRMLAPLGDLEFERAVEIFAKNIRAMDDRADLILIETMNDSYETKAAVLAAKENSNLPIFVTNVYDGSGKTLTGSPPEAMATILEGLGVSAIGANCSFGPREMLTVAERLVNSTALPIVINPNAGLPKITDGETVYDETSDTFSDLMVDMCRLGVSILGGCCGTTPDHIRKTKAKTEGIPLSKKNVEKASRISSAYTAFPLGDKPLLIGERINPTGKPWLRKALQDNQNSKILAEAIKQEETGISAIDVNCGLPKIDEKAKLAELIQEIQSVISLPLVIDSGNPEALEAAARICNGAPLINSVNGSEESLAKVLPIAKKYGGSLICLTMDEGGIPESAEERVAIAERIKKHAEDMEVPTQCLIFDPLALSVSTNEENAEITLAAIRHLTERGMKSSLGVSNISFGMPNREKINSAFFRLALAEGLSAAIINPESAEMMRAYWDFMAVRDDREALQAFKTEALQMWKSALAEAREISLSGVEKLAEKSPKDSSGFSLKQAIIKGLRDQAAELCKKLLEDSDADESGETCRKNPAKFTQNTTEAVTYQEKNIIDIKESLPQANTPKSPMEIIDGEIIPALTAVGEAFDKKEIFLPSLLLSAEAASRAFDQVKKKIQKNSSGKGRIIMATVKGDIHDIGKSIVRVVLESWGFDVVDLGRDVPKERILRELENGETLLVGLSALMTTTLPAMEDTVQVIKRHFPGVKVMVGGAVLTEDYARKIGADFYGKDAPSAAKIANSLIKQP